MAKIRFDEYNDKTLQADFCQTENGYSFDKFTNSD